MWHGVQKGTLMLSGMFQRKAGPVFHSSGQNTILAHCEQDYSTFKHVVYRELSTVLRSVNYSSWEITNPAP